MSSANNRQNKLFKQLLNSKKEVVAPCKYHPSIKNDTITFQEKTMWVDSMLARPLIILCCIGFSFYSSSKSISQLCRLSKSALSSCTSSQMGRNSESYIMCYIKNEGKLLVLLEYFFGTDESHLLCQLKIIRFYTIFFYAVAYEKHQGK